MQKSFSLFLHQLHLTRKSFRELHILKSLTLEDFEELKNLNLLKSDSDATHIMCESCDSPHSVPVKYRDGKFYAACISDSKPRLLNPNEVRKWELNIQGLLQGMANKFGIDASIEALGVEGLWQMGGFSKDDTYHACYFFCGRDFDQVIEFIKTQPENFRRYIVVTSRVTSRHEEALISLPQELLFIEVEHLVSLQSGNLKFNKKVFENHLIRGFRSVLFDGKNGDLSVDGQVVASITPSTPEYHFVQALWEDFNLPRSHGGLVLHIYKKTRQAYADTDGKTCHKMKRNIKKDAKNKEMIDRIFKSTKTENGENGYIMKNPH
jgi:hypothetical protein